MNQQRQPRRRQPCIVQAAGQPDADVDQRRVAAELAVDRYIRSGHTVGLGSGPMTALAIAYLAKQMERGSLRDITTVPGSAMIAREATFHELPTSDLQQHPRVDVTLQDVDQIDSEQLAAIVGVQSKPQQPQLSRLQTLAAASQQLIALVDSPDKVVSRLQGNVPVLVSGETWEDTAEELDDLLLGDAEIWRRSNVPTNQPRALDDPYITADGNNLLDLKFRKPLVEPQEDMPLMYMGEKVPYDELAGHIQGVPGVLDHGLLLGVVSEAVVATEKGPQTVRRVDVSA